jgi:DnaJ-domain-containing protein 1
MGKVVGGAAGFALGGPLGAVAGAVLGHAFDAGENKHYAILGCAKSDSNDQIKKQYRKLVFKYHPDKIESKELPEERIKFASDKFCKIQEAYDAVKRERGL